MHKAHACVCMDEKGTVCLFVPTEVIGCNTRTTVCGNAMSHHLFLPKDYSTTGCSWKIDHVMHCGYEK